MTGKIPSFLLNEPNPNSRKTAGAAERAGFLEKGIHRLSEVIKTTYIQWETARQEGFFQRLDARVKLVFMLFFIVIVSLKRALLPEAIIGIVVFVFAVLSRLELAGFYRRALFFSFVFGFLIALPSSLNIIAKGEVIIPLFELSRPYDFWVYHVPETIGITTEGLQGVALLTSRVFNSVSISFLVIYTTPFSEIIKALKILRAPDTFLMIITLTYKYIFIFAHTAEEMHLAKKGRMIGVDASEAGNWAAGRIAFMFRRTRQRCEDVFKAMLGKCYTGEIRIYEPVKLRAGDFVFGGLMLTIGTGVILI